MSDDKLPRKPYTLTVDASEMEGFKALKDGDMEKIDVVDFTPRTVMSGKTSFETTVELKHDPTRERHHSEQEALYRWMQEVAVPDEPWTFPVHDETQGPDWLVVYTKSHFTGMTPAPGGGVSVGVQMEAREVWLKCPHGMISDDETEAMWLAEKALETPSLTVTPLDVAYEHFEVDGEGEM